MEDTIIFLFHYFHFGLYNNVWILQSTWINLLWAAMDVFGMDVPTMVVPAIDLPAMDVPDMKVPAIDLQVMDVFAWDLLAMNVQAMFDYISLHTIYTTIKLTNRILSISFKY